MKKSFLTAILIMALVFSISLAFFIGVNEGEREGSINTLRDTEKEFSLVYTNNTNQPQEIRYRYELSFETAKDFTLDYWYENDTLFSLERDNLVIASTKLENEHKPIIPEVSNTVQLFPQEKTSAKFNLIMNDNLKNGEDLIRFETKVIIEELRGKRWTPVYQVVFMKRGDYWSLNKGPIEILKP